MKNAHKEFAEFNGLDPQIYDNEGHRVWTISGTVHIDIDGVAFDRIEMDRWLRLGRKKKKD